MEHGDEGKGEDFKIGENYEMKKEDAVGDVPKRIPKPLHGFYKRFAELTYDVEMAMQPIEGKKKIPSELITDWALKLTQSNCGWTEYEFGTYLLTKVRAPWMSQGWKQYISEFRATTREVKK